MLITGSVLWALDFVGIVYRYLIEAFDRRSDIIRIVHLVRSVHHGIRRSVRQYVDLPHFVDGFVTGFGNILVNDGDFQSRYQKTGLAYAVDKLLITEFSGVIEDFRIGPISDTGTGGLRTDLADDLQLGRTVLARAFERRIGRRMLRIRIGVHTGMSLVERHVMRFAVTIHLDVKSGAQSVDHRRAHAMQTAGSAIGGIAELRAGVKLGEHHFHAGKLGFRFHVDGNAAAVVGDFDGTIGMQRHDNMVAGTGKGLIDGVVDDLPQTVHQTLAVGRADVHARTLAHRVQTFQHG